MPQIAHKIAAESMQGTFKDTETFKTFRLSSL
jgi:hypothetical protein